MRDTLVLVILLLLLPILLPLLDLRLLFLLLLLHLVLVLLLLLLSCCVGSFGEGKAQFCQGNYFCPVTLDHQTEKNTFTKIARAKFRTVLEKCEVI